MLLTGVLGAFHTGDLFNLYVWFEVLLISSFGLIVLGGRPMQLDGALRYCILNFLATTIFLVATGLLYGSTGTLNMADIGAAMVVPPAGMPVATIAALFLLGFGMKAAAFPLNTWLPASYHTPPNAVAAIFAGLLTKVGIYALLRTVAVIYPSAPSRPARRARRPRRADGARRCARRAGAGRHPATGELSRSSAASASCSSASASGREVRL